jgi:hypothetical protein
MSSTGHLGDAVVEQRLQRAAGHVAGLVVDLPGELVARLDPDRAVRLVDDVLGGVAPDDRVERHEDLADGARILPLLDHARGDLLAGRRDHLAGRRVDEVVGGLGAADALGEEARRPGVALLPVGDGVVVGLDDAFLVEAERVEQRRHRQLAAAVDASVDEVLGVELEVEPGAAVGDDPAGEEQLAATNASCPCRGRRTRRASGASG